MIQQEQERAEKKKKAKQWFNYCILYVLLIIFVSNSPTKIKSRLALSDYSLR
jgi:hypothetical protein